MAFDAIFWLPVWQSRPVECARMLDQRMIASLASTSANGMGFEFRSQPVNEIQNPSHWRLSKPSWQSCVGQASWRTQPADSAKQAAKKSRQTPFNAKR